LFRPPDGEIVAKFWIGMEQKPRAAEQDQIIDGKLYE
jgi:hypothetical protein